MSGSTKLESILTDLTQAQVLDLFRYDPETGNLYWNAPRGRRRLDRPAGYKTKNGYVKVGIDGKVYLAHRIIWLMVYGEHPPEIDHINRVKGDDRLGNLRASDSSANQLNVGIRRDNKSGVKGVHFYKRAGKWQAYIQVQGRMKYLGYFETLEEAAQARREAELQAGVCVK